MVHHSINELHKDLQLIQTPILVVGGNGFLGSHIVDYLLQAIDTQIHVIDIAKPIVSQSNNPRIEFHYGSLLDYQFIHQTLLEYKIKTIVHTASPPQGKPRTFMYAVNVTGTKNLIQASLSSYVCNFVYTSSSSVVFDGMSDLVLVSEHDSLYCQVPLDAYTETKAIAEDLVLKANHLPTTFGNTLKTIALRPSTIYGPRDTQHVCKLLTQILKNKSQFAIGTGLNKTDFTFVENLAFAHLLACSKLNDKDEKVSGEPFFITDNDPKPVWALCKCLHDHLFGPSGHRACTVLIPKPFMLLVAYLLSCLAWILQLVNIQIDPLITPVRVQLVTRTRTFNIAKAQDRLMYMPLYTMDQAMSICVNWVRSVDTYKSLFVKHPFIDSKLCGDTIASEPKFTNHPVELKGLLFTENHPSIAEMFE